METKKREVLKIEMDSLSKNEEFARVVIAVFMSRLNPTLEEIDDVKTAVSEAVTNAVIHGYKGGEGIIFMEAFMDEVHVESALGQGTCIAMKKYIGG